MSTPFLNVLKALKNWFQHGNPASINCNKKKLKKNTPLFWSMISFRLEQETKINIEAKFVEIHKLIPVVSYMKK